MHTKCARGSRLGAGGNKGFTFVELLIVGIVVVLVVNGVAFALASSGQNIWARTNSQVEAISAVQRAVDRVAAELRQAHIVSLNCAAGLTFVTSLGDDGVYGTPDDGAPITYTLSGTNLMRTVGGDSQVVVGQVTGFTPTCSSTSSVVRLRLTASVPLGTQTILQPLSVNIGLKKP